MPVILPVSDVSEHLPFQTMAVPAICCCRSERAWERLTLQRKRKLYGHLFPPPLSPSASLSLPDWQLRVPPAREKPVRVVSGSLRLCKMLRLLWPRDQPHGTFAVTLKSCDPDERSVYVYISGAGEWGSVWGPGSLPVAPQLADEIKTAATRKVRAIDNWKYWHGTQRPLGWIRTRWVTGLLSCSSW